MANSGTTLRVALGDYPHTLPLKRGEITSSWLKLEFVEVKPLYQAFKPMVREHAFDASEMALVTYFQAKDHNKGLTLLPAAMLARFQHGTMLFNAERGKLAPADLPGKRIGVRSYSQTTGVWIRGILENDYGVDLSGVQWVTFEDGHVAEAADPAGVIRARKDQDITDMLIAVSRLIYAGHVTRYANAKIVIGMGGAALPYVIGRLRKNFTVSKDPLGDPDAALAALYYDTIVQDTRALRYLADVVGSGRIMLGSDMPFPIGDLTPLKIVADTSFSDAERQSINGGLAAKLFV